MALLLGARIVMLVAEFKALRRAGSVWLTVPSRPAMGRCQHATLLFSCADHTKAYLGGQRSNCSRGVRRETTGREHCWRRPEEGVA